MDRIVFCGHDCIETPIDKRQRRNKELIELCLSGGCKCLEAQTSLKACIWADEAA